MPDTIILAMKIEEQALRKIVDVESYNKWTPSLYGVITPPYRDLGGEKHIKCYLNPSKADKANGLYVPRLTLYKQIIGGGFIHILYIEFSAPKILYNNNFDESGENDLDVLCDKLSMLLENKGVHLSKDEIKECEVKAIHYGKNIVLTNYLTPYQIINYVSKADIPLRKRVTNKEYMNGGDGLHIFTNEQGVCLYDKIEELKKATITEKGNSEDDSWCQFGMIDEFITKMKQPFQVLRIESRLETKEAIRGRFAKLKIQIPANPTLEDLYKEKLGQAVLKNEIKTLDNLIPPIVNSREPPEVFAEHLRILNPKAKPKDILTIVGMFCIARNIGFRSARKMLGASYAEWYTLKTKREAFVIPKAPIDYLEEVRKQIESFKPVKLEDYIKK